MQHNSLIQVRIDDSLKKAADALFQDLGLDTPTAIRMFLTQAIKRRGLPFGVTQPMTKEEMRADIVAKVRAAEAEYKNGAELLDAEKVLDELEAKYAE